MFAFGLSTNKLCVSLQKRRLWDKLTASRTSSRHPFLKDGAHLSSQPHLCPLQPKRPVLPHHTHRYSTVSSTCQMPPDSAPLLVPSLGLYLFSVPQGDPNSLTQNYHQGLVGLLNLPCPHFPALGCSLCVPPPRPHSTVLPHHPTVLWSQEA